MKTSLNNRIDESLAKTSELERSTVLPFLTAGYPDAFTTIKLIRAFDNAGARVIELGFPFSDSIADGPVIQNSFHHAIEGGQSVAGVFDIASQVRAEIKCGLVAMVSCSIIERLGQENFLQRAAASGFDGLIVPDMPSDLAITFSEKCREAGLHFVGLIAPTTSVKRAEEIASYTSGFIYQIAVSGTTGERQDIGESIAEQVRKLKQSHGLPVCVGFGVSSPAQVREVCDFSDGAIVGSAIVRRIAACVEKSMPQDELVAEVTSFVKSLVCGSD